MARPVKIISINEDDGALSLDEVRLREVLNQEAIKDKPVYLISIIGPFRKGKSFLLSLILSYLKNPTGWVEEETPIQGFPWRAGSELETKGIDLWSEAFIMKDKNNEEVAVLLMDTQGAFDRESTNKEGKSVLGFATLVVNCLIFNLQSNIQENYLQDLDFLSCFSKIFEPLSGEKSLGKLVFLIRDWFFDTERAHGSQGGHDFVENYMNTSSVTKTEMLTTREGIKSCFHQITGYLMPFPGARIANGQGNEAVCDLEDSFKEHAGEFIKSILLPEKIEVRKIQGHVVKSEMLVDLFRNCVKSFNSSEFDPSPIREFHDQQLYKDAIKNGLTFVEKSLKIFFDDNSKGIDQNVLAIEMKRIEKEALDFFDKQIFLRGDKKSIFRMKLSEKIRKLFDNANIKNFHIKNDRIKGWMRAGKIVTIAGGCISAVSAATVAIVSTIAATTATATIATGTVLLVTSIGSCCVVGGAVVFTSGVALLGYAGFRKLFHKLSDYAAPKKETKVACQKDKKD